MNQHFTTHHSVRHRIKVEEYPSVDPRIRMLDRIILVFAVCGPFATIPQVLKIFVEHQTNASILSWSLYIVFHIPLIVYGIVHKQRVVFYNSSLNIMMEILVILGIVLYG